MYGGTKEEMQRLLNDAEKLSGKKFDLSSYADVVDAIHIVQTEMGITGTTASEASETISGSVASMKSAWENLIVGIADENADFDTLVNNFVDSVGVAAENIVPRVEKSISGIASLIEKLAPIVAEKVPKIAQNILPNVINAATTLVNGFIDGIVTLLPTIVESGGEVIVSLLDGILKSTPKIVEGASQAVNSFVDFVIENLPKIVESGVAIIAQLAVGIIKALPDLVMKVPQIINAIVEALAAGIGEILNVGKNIAEGIWEGIKSKERYIKRKVTGFFQGIVTTVKEILGIHSPSRVFAEIGQNIGLGVAVGVDSSKDEAVKAADELAKSVYKNNVEWLDRGVKYNKFTVKEQIEAWEAIQGQFISTSKQYADAEKQILDLREKAQQDYYNSVDAIQKEYSDALDSRTSEIYGSYSLFGEVEKRTRVDGNNLFKNMKIQLATMKEFYDGIQELKDRGVSDGLVEEIRAMGPSAINELNAVLSMNDKKLASYSDLYEEKRAYSAKEAEKELAGFRDDAINRIAEIGKSFPDNIQIVLRSENGESFGRWLVPWIRSENAANPEIVSDAV